MSWADVINAATQVGGLAYSIYAGEESRALAEQNANRSGDIANQQMAMSWEQWDRYKNIWGPVESAQAMEQLEDIARNKTYKDNLYDELNFQLDAYRPLEEQLIADAEEGVSGERWAAEASADVAQSFDKARGIQDRNMTRVGVDPSSTKFQALSQDWARDRALADAGAQNQARRIAEDVNRNLRYNALNYRKGNPIPQTNTASGNASLQSALSGMNSANQTFTNLSNSASQASALNLQTAGYLANSLSKSEDKGGVDWDGAWSSLSGLFVNNGS